LDVSSVDPVTVQMKNKSIKSKMASCTPYIPDQTPPKTVAVMLQDVLTTYSTANCPFKLDYQVCYVNTLKDSGAPFTTKNEADSTATIGVIQDSLIRHTTNGDQYFATAPTDSPYGITHIEFLLAPPDSSGNPQCSYFDKYDPTQCTFKMSDCTTRCQYDGSLPCADGTEPQKIGPCLSHSSWKGWTMQGYQCIPTTYACDFNSGTCQIEKDGPFKSLDTCTSNCIQCPARGFVVANKDGVPECYRSPYTGRNYSGSGSNDICVAPHAPHQNFTNPGSCGNNWTPLCIDTDIPRTACTDQLTTPYMGYQCTAKGYVQCNNKNGCSPIPNMEITNATPCTLPSGSKLYY